MESARKLEMRAILGVWQQFWCSKLDRVFRFAHSGVPAFRLHGKIAFLEAHTKNLVILNGEKLQRVYGAHKSHCDRVLEVSLRQCAGSPNNCVLRRSELSAIDLTAKAICDRLVLVSGPC